MKKLAFMAVAALMATTMMTGCSKESKAKSLAKEYLEKNLNDPDSYEEVEWGTLDSTYSSLETDSAYFFASLEFDDLKAKCDEFNFESSLGGMTDEEMAEWKEDIAKLEKQGAVLDSIDKNFKSEFNGYKISHKYRATNKLGAKTIGTSVFYFDKDMTKVVNVKN